MEQAPLGLDDEAFGEEHARDYRQAERPAEGRRLRWGPLRSERVADWLVLSAFLSMELPLLWVLAGVQSWGEGGALAILAAGFGVAIATSVRGLTARHELVLTRTELRFARRGFGHIGRERTFPLAAIARVRLERPDAIGLQLVVERGEGAPFRLRFHGADGQRARHVGQRIATAAEVSFVDRNRLAAAARVRVEEHAAEGAPVEVALTREEEAG